jgi:hypothetical protein
MFPTKQNARKRTYHFTTLSTCKESDTATTRGSLRHEGKDQSVVEQQVQWLEFSMLEQGFSPIDVREVAVTLERASKQDPTTLAGGIVEFPSAHVAVRGETYRLPRFCDKGGPDGLRNSLRRMCNRTTGRRL